MDFNINKEESSRCIAIALDKWISGDLEEALRCLEKSLKLFPTTKAQELLDRLRLEIIKKKVHEHHKRQPSPHGPRKRRQSQEGASQSHDSASNGYTVNDAQAVMRVQKCTSHYEILAIPKGTFSKTLLKTQYKKLALLVHPDKNRAPGAGEAFKLIGNANTILSDPEKKVSYDQELEVKRLAAQNQNNYYPAEEQIHRAYAPQPSYTTNSEYFEYRYYEQEQTWFARKQMTMLFLPIVLLFVVGMATILLPNIFNPRAQANHGYRYGKQHEQRQQKQEQQQQQQVNLEYSFVQTIKCPLKYTTRNLGVKYYLNAHPAALSARAHMEWTVEEKYMKSLRESCAKERFYKEDFLDRARRNMDKNHIIQGRKLATPSCDAYKRAEAKM